MRRVFKNSTSQQQNVNKHVLKKSARSDAAGLTVFTNHIWNFHPCYSHIHEHVQDGLRIFIFNTSVSFFVINDVIQMKFYQTTNIFTISHKLDKCLNDSGKQNLNLLT